MVYDSADKTLRGAIIGCGFFAQNHLHAWRDVTGAVLEAVCDRERSKAERAAQAFGITKVYTDARDMLFEESLDFVDVATTMESHRALVELAADRRVPVICQKPMAPSLEDAEAMVAACERVGVPLMIHENFRFQTPIRAVRTAINEDAVGRPFFARISLRTGYDVFANQPYLAEVDRLIILDLGIHLLDVARFLLGEAAWIACVTGNVRPDIQGEDAASMLIQHEGAAASVVDCTFSAHRNPDSFPETLIELDGTDGSIIVDAGFEMSILSKNGTERRSVSPSILSWATPPWHVIQESVLNTQQYFIDSLREGRTPQTAGSDNLKTFRLVEAAYRAAETGTAVSLDD